MENQLTHNEDIYNCQLCKNEYDSRERIPKDLDCGHSICLHCLKTTTTKSNKFKCAECNSERALVKGAEKLPTNHSFLKVIQSRAQQKGEVCEKHTTYFKDCVCLDDRCQICLFCVVFDDHRNHRTLNTAELTKQVDKKVDHLDGQLKAFGSKTRKLNQFLKKDRVAMRKKVKESFDSIASALGGQRDRILEDVDQVYKYRTTKKLKTECYTQTMELAKDMSQTIVDLKNDRYDDPFFDAYEAEDIIIPLDSLKEEYSEMEYECKKISDYLAENLGQHCKALLEQIGGIKPVHMDFDPLSPLREESEELEPESEFEPELEAEPQLKPESPIELQQEANSKILDTSSQPMNSAQEPHQPEQIQPIQDENDENSDAHTAATAHAIVKRKQTPLTDATNQMLVEKSDTMSLTVVTATTTFEIIAGQSSSIESIKQEFCAADKAYASSSFIYQSKELNCTQTVLDCGIKPKSTLYLGSMDWYSSLKL